MKKSNTHQKARYILAAALFCFLSTVSMAQTLPPTQGPPLAPAENTTPPTGYVCGNEGIKIQVTDQISAAIKVQVDSFNAHHNSYFVTFSLKVSAKPYMTSTQYTDRPNQNILAIPYTVNYNIAIPHWPDHQLSQQITINVSCQNWATNSGRIAYEAVVNQPYPVQPGLVEQATDFIFANAITNYINGRINGNLPAASTTGTSTSIPCNCLGVANISADHQTDDIVQCYKKAPTVIVSPLPYNEVQVTLKSIKRLKAEANNAVLYYPSENIQILFYADQSSTSPNVSNIVEGQEVQLNEPAITLPRPANTDSIVLLGTIIVQSSGDVLSNTAFKILKSNTDFGNGTQILTIPKTYIIQPTPIPGGGTSHPSFGSVDAYQLTIQINAPLQPVKK